MRTLLIITLFLTSTIIASSASSAFSASNTSLVYGRILYNAKNNFTPLDEATILLERADGAILETYSNQKGIFVLYDVAYGNYTMKISMNNETLRQEHYTEGKTQWVEARPVAVDGEREKLGVIIVTKSSNIQDFGDYFYSISSKSSDDKMCIDIKDPETGDGARVQHYNCKSNGNDNQLFKLVEVSDGYYSFKSKADDRYCLDVKNKAMSRRKIQQYKCTGKDNQQFAIVLTGKDYYSIVAKHSGYCIDVRGSGQSSVAKIQQHYCNGKDDQLWSLKKQSPTAL